MTNTNPDADIPNQGIPKVCILGIGQMGLVCAGALANPDPRGVGQCERAQVIMWGHSEEENGALSQTRKTDRLPGFELPGCVRVAMSDEEALSDADIIVNAIPVQFIRGAWERIAEHVPKGASVISVAKGIENKTLLRPTRMCLAMILMPNLGRLGVCQDPRLRRNWRFVSLRRCPQHQIIRGLPKRFKNSSQRVGFGYIPTLILLGLSWRARPRM